MTTVATDTPPDELVLSLPADDRLELRRLGDTWMVRAAQARGRSPVAYLEVGRDPVLDATLARLVVACRGAGGHRCGPSDLSPRTRLAAVALAAVFARLSAGAAVTPVAVRVGECVTALASAGVNVKVRPAGYPNDQKGHTP